MEQSKKIFISIKNNENNHNTVIIKDNSKTNLKNEKKNDRILLSKEAQNKLEQISFWTL